MPYTIERYSELREKFSSSLLPPVHISPHYSHYIEYIQGIEYDMVFSVMDVISYKPFYETLFKKGITEYHLIFHQGFSANTLHRIKKGEAISTKTLDALCYALDCEVNDIIRFEKE